MPITITKLAMKLSTVVLPIDDEDSITIHWRVGQMNKETRQEYMLLVMPDKADATTRDDVNAAVDVVENQLDHLLVKLVQSWDILDEDGVTMFPITMDRLPELAYVWRNKILNAIMLDAGVHDEGEVPAATPPPSNGSTS